MLVLTRKVGELIRIGEDVSVQVLEVRGNQVKLGFAAPKEIRIFREEIFRGVQGQNDQARLPDPGSLSDAAAAWEAYVDGKRD